MDERRRVKINHIRGRMGGGERQRRERERERMGWRGAKSEGKR